MSNNDYSITEKDICELCGIEETNTLLERIFDHYPLNCVNVHKFEYEKLDRLCEMLEKNDTDRKEIIKSIVSLIRIASTGIKDPCPITEKIKAEITSNPACELSVRELADKIGISLYYMIHVFKKETGKTITEYKTDCKMEKAKGLLSQGNKPVTDIAMECGFATSSYFSQTFKQIFGITPGEYRKMMTETKKDNPVLNIANDNDIILYNMLEHKSIISEGFDISKIVPSDTVKTYAVSYPSEEYGFLHEAAIIEYEGQLFAAWYNCPKKELADSSPIRFSKSFDGGKTWTEPKTVVNDPSGKILYCPPVFGVQDGKLYMFINQMTKPDCIHSLDLYIYDSDTDNFTELWSRADIPVKLNTNVYTLSNGKLMLPGRWCVRDTFSDVPCVLISDSGRIDDEWRIVMIQETHNLPDGSKLVHPEMSAIIDGETVYIFCRTDERNIPVLYISKDNGETWSEPISHDIPFSNSKIYSGNLSDGRSYLIGNLFPGRSKLAIFFSEKDDVMKFTNGIVLRDAKNDELDLCSYWCYPIAHEYEGRLYVIYTFDLGFCCRGAAISVIHLDKV